MRLVQTFWSCNRNLIENNFGWFSPQHHLMAWALSCLKLKEHYDDLHLYTDSNGIEVLIDYLGLPYKTALPCYNNLGHYGEHLWAVPKIMTYLAQDEPFIHVDGDIFIWEKFRSSLENADLIAQNFEIGTDCYKTSMNEVRKFISHMPSYLEEELDKESISAYNAGLFGGKDNTFIKKYCSVALKLIDENVLSSEKKEIPGPFNILFEQILFYALTAKENKQVTCFFNERFEDNRYSIEEHADFMGVPNRLKYLHLIGNHKRNGAICELMSRILFKEYPEYYYKIIALFKEEHVHFEDKVKSILPKRFHNSINNCDHLRIVNGNLPTHEEKRNTDSFVIQEAVEFEQQLAGMIKNWETIPAIELYQTEADAIDYFDFFFKSKEEQLNTVLKKNPYIEVVENSFDWSADAKQQINPNLINELNEVLGIACIPQLFFVDHRKIIIDEMDYNILALLEQPAFLKDILVILENCFANDGQPDSNAAVYELALNKLKYLFLNKCIYIQNAVNALELYDDV